MNPTPEQTPLASLASTLLTLDSADEFDRLFETLLPVLGNDQFSTLAAHLDRCPVHLCADEICLDDERDPAECLLPSTPTGSLEEEVYAATTEVLNRLVHDLDGVSPVRIAGYAIDAASEAVLHFTTPDGPSAGS